MLSYNQEVKNFNQVTFGFNNQSEVDAINGMIKNALPEILDKSKDTNMDDFKITTLDSTMYEAGIMNIKVPENNPIAIDLMEQIIAIVRTNFSEVKISSIGSI